MGDDTVKSRREFIAGIIVGEYRFSALRYTHETRRTYWFTKYGVKIGIPKKMLNERLRESEQSAKIKHLGACI